MLYLPNSKKEAGSRWYIDNLLALATGAAQDDLDEVEEQRLKVEAAVGSTERTENQGAEKYAETVRLLIVPEYEIEEVWLGEEEGALGAYSSEA